MSNQEGNRPPTTLLPDGPDSEVAHVSQPAQLPIVSSSDVSEQEERKGAELPTEPAGMQRGLRFWSIIASLCVTGLLSALENTVVTTSLPTIIRELNVGDNYIWITNVFFLTRYDTTSALVLPLVPDTATY